MTLSLRQGTTVVSSVRDKAKVLAAGIENSSRMEDYNICYVPAEDVLTLTATVEIEK